MTGEFKNHFSTTSAGYRRYRPRYPAELFSYLASLCTETGQAWDCATGSGQAALMLSECFTRVIATDASSSQIDSARRRSNIRYGVAQAERSQLQAATIDLITVAQALHWFDIEAFAMEADRVLKSGAILAVWTYNLLRVREDINQHIAYLYSTVLDGYWPEERRMVENSYDSIHLPFLEIKPPLFRMAASWDLPQLMGYLATWSACTRYREKRGIDPLDEIAGALSTSWGDPKIRREIEWPLSLRVWKKQEVTRSGRACVPSRAGFQTKNWIK